MSQVIVKYIDENGQAQVKDSIQMDATLFIKFVYATAIMKGWNIKSIMTFVLG